ncbi:MAG: tetratricopeptide repeat protein, partial [Blastocatellia bacterium]
AGVLVLLAVLDQTRFFLAVDANDLSNLQRAVRLNPYDAGVHASLARAREGLNDSDRALTEFEQSVRLNPYNPEVRGTFFRLLLEQGDYERAYSEYKQLAPYTRNDPDALLNFGILADRLGHREEAIQSWKRALSVAPETKSAHLYLADALYAEGKHKEAIPHYERYLAMLSSDPDPDMDPRDVVGITLRIGDAYGSVKNSPRAMVLYDKASGIAEKTGIKSLESLVLEHKGNLLAGAGLTAQAADFYQRALRLDVDAKDDKAAALDWFGYAQFLSDAGKPKDLVLGCAMKAENLLSATPGPELNLIKRYRETTEASVTSAGGNSAAEKVRRDLDSVIKEALSLRF